MRKFLTIIVAVVLVVVAVGVWYTTGLKPVDSGSNKRVTLKIEKGTTGGQIAQLLEERGLIRSSVIFDLHTRLNGLQSSLQAGSFVLKPSFSVAEIVEILQTGKAEEMAVTVPEGFTVTDIDALLAEKDLLEPGEFLACVQDCDLSDFTFLPDSNAFLERGGRVEGYLFPDTYFIVAEDFSAQKFLRRLLTTFQVRVVKGLEREIVKSERSLHEAVTMASLIEEEASTDEERPVISGILWKRFDEGMGLGVDATVRYVLNKPRAAITIADLNHNSPYNTRKFKGLPPGPIASPGQKSLEATLEPSKTKYWYYLHDKEGQIRYAKTNEEHNINRNTYLK